MEQELGEDSPDPDRFRNTQGQLKDWISKLTLVLQECHPKTRSPEKDIRKTTTFSK